MNDGPGSVRFDDRMETVLRIDPASRSGKAAIWHQLIDMLAQSGSGMSAAAAGRGLAALAILRSDVPVSVRVVSAQAVASRCNFAPVAALLAADVPAVANTLMDHLVLSDANWTALIPELGPLGRSRLRRRSNLPSTVQRALASFGAHDFALPPARGHAHIPVTDAAMAPPTALAPQAQIPNQANVAPAITAASDIADLVRRIEAYRRRTPQTGDSIDELTVNAALASLAAEYPEQSPAMAASETFELRADAQGNIRAATADARPAFVGLTMADPARAAESGFDAGVARAFSKRAPIHAGRLWVAGQSRFSGIWSVDAQPLFDRLDGRFQGYALSLARFGATTDEASDVAAQAANATLIPEAEQPNGAADAGRASGMRQMVHELRSPLNAIAGFAQLIEGQYFGPVAEKYRLLARSIISDANGLARSFEDIDLAARLDLGSLPSAEGETLLLPLVQRTVAGFAAAQPGHAPIVVIGDAAPVCVGLNEGDVRQMLDRLLAHAASLCAPLSIATVHISAHPGIHAAAITVSLPSADGVAATQASAPPTAAVLDMDFSLRMLERLAQHHHSMVIVESGQCILNLPLVHCTDNRIGSTG